ncbi:hypothetical protein P3T18_000999 [Paraburkholderia sp. GAS199]
MLSWKIMKATEAACQSICMGREAAEHYGYRYAIWHQWSDWLQDFVAGWVGDHKRHVPVTQRALRIICRRREAPRLFNVARGS